MLNNLVMKRKTVVYLIVVASSLVVGGLLAYDEYSRMQEFSMFNANVEILAACESHIGFCREEKGDCVGVCPECGVLVFAMDHSGPAYGISSH